MAHPHIHRNYEGNMTPFKVEAPFEPMGDQPAAIQSLVQGVNNGDWAQVLLGATGTGKTYTMAKLIEGVQKPTLVIAHNKTLAAQLCSEFKSFFPIMRWNILCLIMIFTNRKHILRQPIHILKKMHPLTMKSINCVTRLQ